MMQNRNGDLYGEILVVNNLIITVFRPSGWDNVSKISILDEQMNHIKADDAFEDHIKKPEYRRVGFVVVFCT